MSDATYILGTVEYLMVEITDETPGNTFDPADWTAAVYLADSATSVVIEDVTAGDWETATIETVGTRFYAKVLIGDDLDPQVGTYRAYVKLTPDSGSELPILKAEGLVTIVGE
jgi:3-oxoacyl-[acyl-carrier-protein] synthase III